MAQTASQPWPVTEELQQKTIEDEWSSLLLRFPPFPFIPPYNVVKQPVKQSLAKIRSMDRLQPPLKLQDDWYQYFDQLLSLPLLEQAELTSPFQDEDKNIFLAEKEETTEEVIERLQETMALVDMLRERDDLERSLREVRDLEERLQDVDERAERLQEVLEEELGKEVVDQLMEVEDKESGLRQVVVITEMVKKRAVKELEENEVDELEDEIKRVFFKGLLPEEEVGAHQDSRDEMTGNSPLDDDLRKMMYQTETEGNSKVEGRTGSLDLDRMVPAIVYQKVEQMTKKTVTIVETPEVMFEGDGQMQERLRERGVFTERLQPVDSSQADTDVWFTLFDSSPYKAVFKPQAVTRGRAQVEEEKYLTLSTEFRFGEEKTEMILEEKLRKPKDDEAQHTVNFPLPQSEKDDDWFVLLDVSPRQTPYVPPVAWKGTDLVEAERVFSVENTVEEWTNQVAAEEIKIIDAAPVVLQKFLQQPVRERDDNWFVLLDVVPRTSLVPAVAVSQSAEEPPVDSVSVVKMKTTEQEAKTIEAVIDSTKLDQGFFLPQTEREIEDIWFVLMDVPNRESLFVPPVVSMAEYPEVYLAESISVSTPRVSTKMEVVEEIVVHKEDMMLPKSAVWEVKQSFRERSDDWFLLLDVVAKETAYVSPVAVIEPVVAISGPKVIVDDEKPPVKMVVGEPPRQVDDDWFVLLDVAPKSAVTVEQRVFPNVQPAKEQKLQQRITVETETRKQGKVLESLPAVREVEDDWCILLDVATKKSVTGSPEKTQYPAEVRAPVAIAKSRITISEPRPEFGKQILQERRPLMYTLADDDDDWFVLLDLAPKVSVVSTQRGTRPVSAPVFSQAALAEAGIPMAPFDQPQTSTPIKTTRKEDRKLEVTVEAVEPSKIESVADVKTAVWRDEQEPYSSLVSTINGDTQHESETSMEVVRLRKKRKKIEADSIYIRHSLLMLEDFDKPNEDLVKHHASISELKRNFMEAVPEPRPSEWDKRLSTHSPFRSLGINGQPLSGADGASDEGTEKDSMTMSSSTSVTSETTSGTAITTTTTHISKVVKSGSMETRVEKRIVITADSDTDQDKGKDGGSSAL